MAEGVLSAGAERGSQFKEGSGWVTLSREQVKAGRKGLGVSGLSLEIL